MDLQTLSALKEEFLKIAAAAPPPLPPAANPMAKALFGGMKKTDVFKDLTSAGRSGAKNELLKKLVKKASGAVEVAGLGMLAAPSIDNMVAKARARRAGSSDVDKFRVIKDKYHDPVEVAGLGVLAAPYIKNRLTTGKWG